MLKQDNGNVSGEQTISIDFSIDGEFFALKYLYLLLQNNCNEC